MKKLCFILCSILISGLLPAQETDDGADLAVPEEPGIILPTMLLEVEDITIETVDVPLPAEEKIESLDIDIPLPEEEDLYISDDSFSLPVYDQQGNATGDRLSESSFFSTGIIGAGSMNHILGSVALYKLGTEPRFRFRFSHEGIDGYGFRAPGSGFFSREDLLEGWLAYRSDSIELETEAGFIEREQGLQGRSDFYSAALRFLSLSPAFLFRPVDFFTLTLDSEVSSGSRIMAVASQLIPAERQSEFYVAPQLDLRFAFSSFTIGLTGSYGFQFVDQTYPVHRASTGIDAELILFDSLILNGSVGSMWQWDPAYRVLLPFQLGLDLSVQSALRIFASGGQRVSYNNYTGLWKDFPLLSMSTALPPSYELFAGGGFSWSIAERVLQLDAGIEFADRKNIINPELNTGFSTAAGTFSFSVDSMQSLYSDVGVKWKISDLLSFEAGWNAVFLQRSNLEAAHRLNASFGLVPQDEAYGVSIDAVTKLEGEPMLLLLPNLNASGFVKITDGVRLDLEIKDILSPFLGSGRPGYGPFIEPGFRAILKTQISL
jgi:hypothetical protein